MKLSDWWKVSFLRLFVIIAYDHCHVNMNYVYISRKYNTQSWFESKIKRPCFHRHLQLWRWVVMKMICSWEQTKLQNSGPLKSVKKNSAVILQFQNLPWQLPSNIFAEVSTILCWDPTNPSSQHRQINIIFPTQKLLSEVDPITGFCFNFPYEMSFLMDDKLSFRVYLLCS